MVVSINRRLFLHSGIGALSLPMLNSLRANEPAIRKSTYTYKRVGDLEIKLDVYRPDDRKTRPLAVWIHGGALMMGHRDGISSRVKKMLFDRGYALASIDYRLAPETKLPKIIQDVEDAFKWLRSNGAQKLNVDVSKIAVLGGSAGGYLTLTAGFRVKPKPTVLVSFWGYGDLVGDWYSKPSPHARHRRTKLSREEAFAQVKGPAISDARDRKGDGGAFYQHCRQQGIWPREVSGWDPHKEAKKFFPYMAVKNVTADYPPTLLIHGTKDTDVPYEQSVMMAEQLKRNKVEHELISLENGEHGLWGAAPKQINEAYAKVPSFIDKYMKPGQ